MRNSRLSILLILTALLFALPLSAGVTACGPSHEDQVRDAPYAIAVNVRFPTNSNITLYWADQSPADGVQGGSSHGNITLSRGFSSREEAFLFRESYVVLENGQEAAREEVSFQICDHIEAFGHSVEDRPFLRLDRALHELKREERPDHSAYRYACRTDTVFIEDLDESRITTRLSLEAGPGVGAFLLNGAPLSPISVGKRWDHYDTSHYEVHLHRPLGTPLEDQDFALEFILDGESRGVMEIDRAICEANSRNNLQRSVGLIRETMSLIYEGTSGWSAEEIESLQLDRGEGLSCEYEDGISYSMIP